MMPLQYRARGALSDLAVEIRNAILARRAPASSETEATVAALIADVRARSDAALRAQARELDKVELSELEVPRTEWHRALGAIPPAVRLALERAAENIARVHAAWLPQRIELEVQPGVRVVRRPIALARAGIYVPGGGAAYASSLLMGVVPARVAGVDEIIVCTPPGASGRPADVLLAAAEIAGASRVFAVGGAGAIAAMTLGTASIPSVDCIAGPGNSYVTEAKLQLMREVRVDLPAGPSELLVIADDTADLASVAAELLAQAEHGCDSAVVALAIGRGVAERLADAISDGISPLQRAETIRAALQRHGALLEATSFEEGFAFAEEYAPEHLLLATRNAEHWAGAARNAGSVFVRGASVVYGDYLTGANHVLPTAGYARTHSGLGTEFFMRWVTIQSVAPAAAREIAPIAATLARAEGLDAHAAAALRAAGF
ncbi:MAG TPA: histidinol dehydrogenase [Gemmatimonadaceae bacterium]|nr:histidinol dehydrogenase [Gemmatimonadaceae bacterium]